MSRIKRAIHDAWCAVTRRCGWDQAEDTPVIAWLRDQEAEANRSMDEIRRRQQNLVEFALLHERLNRERKAGRGD